MCDVRSEVEQMDRCYRIVSGKVGGIRKIVQRKIYGDMEANTMTSPTGDDPIETFVGKAMAGMIGGSKEERGRGRFWGEEILSLTKGLCLTFIRIFLHSCVIVLVDEEDLFEGISINPSSGTGSCRIRRTVQLPSLGGDLFLTDPSYLTYAVFSRLKESDSGYNERFLGFFPCNGPVLELYRFAKNPDVLTTRRRRRGPVAGRKVIMWSAKYQEEDQRPMSKKCGPEISARNFEGVIYVSDNRSGVHRLNVPAEDLMGIDEVEKFLLEEVRECICEIERKAPDEREENNETKRKGWENAFGYVRGVVPRWKRYVETRLPVDMRKEYLGSLPQLKLVDSYRSMRNGLAKSSGESKSDEDRYGGSQGESQGEDDDDIGECISGITLEYARCPVFIPLSIPYFPYAYEEKFIHRIKRLSTVKKKTESRHVAYDMVPEFGTNEGWSFFVLGKELTERTKDVWELCKWFEVFDTNASVMGPDTIGDPDEYELMEEYNRIASVVGCDDRFVSRYVYRLPGGDIGENMTGNGKKRFLMRKREMSYGAYWSTRENRYVTKFTPDGNEDKKMEGGRNMSDGLESDALHTDFFLDYAAYLFVKYLFPVPEFSSATIRGILRFRIREQRREFVRHFSPSTSDETAVYTGLLARFRIHTLVLNGLLDDYMGAYYDALDEFSMIANETRTFSRGNDWKNDGSATETMWIMFANDFYKFYDSIPPRISMGREGAASAFGLLVEPDSLTAERSSESEKILSSMKLSLPDHICTDDFLCMAIDRFDEVILGDLKEGLMNTEKIAYDPDDPSARDFDGMNPDDASYFKIVRFHALLLEVAKSLPERKVEW